MIDEREARAIAGSALDELSGKVGIKLAFEPAAARSTPEGLFFWNSSAYLESGSISDALAGNGPFLVNRENGRVRRLSVTEY